MSARSRSLVQHSRSPSILTNFSYLLCLPITERVSDVKKSETVMTNLSVSPFISISFDSYTLKLNEYRCTYLRLSWLLHESALCLCDTHLALSHVIQSVSSDSHVILRNPLSLGLPRSVFPRFSCEPLFPHI